VVAVVPGEQRDAGRLGCLDQPGAPLHGVPDRLLHEHRHPGRDALQAAVDVQLVGRREDDAVGLVFCEQLGQRPVRRDPELVGHLLGRRGGIDDRRELRRTARVDLLDVPPADQAGARHGDPDRTGHGQLPCWESWYRPLIARL
jgi:hypothetical protein